jgi:tetratricopeptide (TPR) repeat protein
MFVKTPHALPVAQLRDRPDAVAFARVFVALDAGRIAEAAKILRELRPRQSRDPMYWFLDGTLHALHNDLEPAAESFRQCIRLKPDMALAHTGLGHVLSDQGKLRDAVPEYHAATRCDPSDWVAYQNAGLTSAMLGEQEKAIACFNSAIRLEPKRAHLHRYRAQALAELGKNIDAFAAFNTALKIDPRDSATYSAMGALHLKLKHPGDSIDALKKAIILDPADSRAHLLLGDAAFATRDLRSARLAWQNASRLDLAGPVGDSARRRLKQVADVQAARS